MRRSLAVLSVVLWGVGGVTWAADTYTLDASHASVGFSVRHLGISNVKGTFPKVSGTLMLDEKKIEKSSVDISIDAASVDTNQSGRDEHLRGADFFDVATFPLITFKSRSVKKAASGYMVDGDLTIKGVTRPVSIPFVMSAPMDHPMMPVRVVGAEGSLTINRRDFNITYGPAAMISDEVKIDLQVEFTTPKADKK